MTTPNYRLMPDDLSRPRRAACSAKPARTRLRRPCNDRLRLA